MLSPEDEAELRATADEVSAIRAQLAQAPADMVVANHVMGLYELAAVLLSQDPPHFVEARLAIDAMTGVMERCKGRLGDAEATLVGAVQQLQLTFVTLTSQQSTG